MKNKKIREVAEMLTLKYLINQFPTGILSVVSDTYDLWDVCKPDGILYKLKEEILARDGKIVIRPDSGNPVDIICGKENLDYIYLSQKDLDELNSTNYHKVAKDCGFQYTEDFFEGLNDTIFLLEEGEVYTIKRVMRHDVYPDFEKDSKIYNLSSPESKGVIELLWDVFGGTFNEQGYKVLNPKIGAIYGDSINLERFQQINERLEAKGFASTNWVAGIGSFTYQFNTRDTFGFAMKATYVEVEEPIYGELLDQNLNTKKVGRPIFKDPITDDGTKKSAKGLLAVGFDEADNNPQYYLVDQISWEKEGKGSLQVIFEDGVFKNETTLEEIRSKLNQ